MHQFAIKMEKHSKNKSPSSTSNSWLNLQAMPNSTPTVEALSQQDKCKDKGKGIFKEFPNKLDGKRCFK